MSYLSPLAASLTPYVPGEQPRGQTLIKLNTNENPYPPSPRVVEAILGAAGTAGENLGLYPDPESLALRRLLAEQHGVNVENIFVGNGSDEVLAFVFAAFFAGGPVAMPEIGYSFYPVYARLYGAQALPSRVDDALRVDVESLLGLQAPVVLANPNAPTARALPSTEILTLGRTLAERGQVLVVDEAYAAFSDCSIANCCARADNLLVVRTLSKSHALAGLRVGYAVGHAGLIDGLTRVKDSFNSYPLDRLAQAGAYAALSDTPYSDARIHEICKTRDAFRQRLLCLGMECAPSEANFVFTRNPCAEGKALYAALRERGILVRHFDSPRLTAYLRISVGTPEQMDTVARAMEAILSEMGALS